MRTAFTPSLLPAARCPHIPPCMCYKNKVAIVQAGALCDTCTGGFYFKVVHVALQCNYVTAPHAQGGCVGSRQQAGCDSKQTSQETMPPAGNWAHCNCCKCTNKHSRNKELTHLLQLLLLHAWGSVQCVIYDL